MIGDHDKISVGSRAVYMFWNVIAARFDVTDTYEKESMIATVFSC